MLTGLFFIQVVVLFESRANISKFQLISETTILKRNIYDFSYTKKMYIHRTFQNICRNVSYRSGFRGVQVLAHLPKYLHYFHYLLLVLNGHFHVVSTWNPRGVFAGKPLVILIKKLFIIVANCFSFETRFPFPLRRSLFEFSPLLLKYGLIVFQNFLLSDKSCMFKFWK